MLTHGTKAPINTQATDEFNDASVANVERGGRRGDQPASQSCTDAVNLVDQPDLPDNIALG